MYLDVRLVCKTAALSAALAWSMTSSLAQAVSTEDVPRLAGSGLLHTVGNQIIDEQGKAIRLRGVNMHTYYDRYSVDKTAPLKYATEADIKYLKSLGVNSIRLGLSWQYFKTNLGYQLIDTYVKWCEDAGIYLILDMHVVPPETAVGQGKIWNNPAAQQKFINLWTAIASRYANKKVIAGYDIFNEPAPADAKKWWSLVDSTVAAIRSVDSGHMLFIEPASTTEAKFQLVNDSNVVYSFHNYKPYLVSHAGYAGASDSPVPTDYAYPGLVLTTVYTNSWGKGFNVIKPITEWTKLESHELTVPDNVQFATAKITAVGRLGNLWVDDLSLTQNGSSVKLLNANMEQASITNAKQPANWRFTGSGDFTGVWDQTVNQPFSAANGKSSLKLSGTNGGGSWTQVNQFYTAPLVKVKAGDKISFNAWVYAPDLKRAEFGVNLEYLNGSYELYNQGRLSTDIQPYITWAKNNNVPLYVGEFGALSSAPRLSRYKLIRDQMKLMNTANLSWSLWNYRDLAKPSFGLYTDQQLDKSLATLLKNGLK